MSGWVDGAGGSTAGGVGDCFQFCCCRSVGFSPGSGTHHCTSSVSLLSDTVQENLQGQLV